MRMSPSNTAADAAGERPLRRHAAHQRGADGGDPGRHRLGQEHPGAADPPALRRHRGQRLGRRPGCAGIRPAGAAGRGGHRAAEKRPVLRHGAGQPAAGATRTPDDETLWAACRTACADEFLRADARRVWTPTWGRAASTSPAGRSSACASPAPCSKIRRF